MTPDLKGAVWHKASRSGGNGGQCVEVATDGRSWSAVRDSKNPGPALVFGPARWGAFVLRLKG